MSTKTRGMVVFLLIAFGLAWVNWAVLISVYGTTPPNTLLGILAGLPAAFAPAIAAIVVRKWVTREGFADAGLRLNLRRGWPYYLFGWLWPLVVVAVVAILATVLGIGIPDLSFGDGLTGLPILSSIPWLIVPVLLILAIIVTPLLWGEEFGWRGYLQIRLFADRPLLAAVATGVIWGIWHYPLIVVTGFNYPDHPFLGLIPFTVFTVLISIIFGWLRLRTGSTWTSSLAHSAINAYGDALLRLLFPTGSTFLVGYGGLLALAPIGVLCVWIVASGQLKPQPPEPPAPETAATNNSASQTRASRSRRPAG